MVVIISVCCVVIQSVIDEEAKGHSAKHVFISGQTTHITIEEEHPGGEELNSESPTEDDDFDDVHTLPSAKHGNAIEFLYLCYYYCYCFDFWTREGSQITTTVVVVLVGVVVTLSTYA